MKFQELKKNLIDCAMPVYLIDGEDAFFRERAVKLIEDRYLSNKEMNYSAFEGSELKNNVETFISAVTSYPFLSEKRIVVVRDYYPLAQDLKNKTLTEYFDNPEQSTVLIIVNSQKNENVKKLKNVTYVDCGKGSDALLVKWIENEFKSAGIACDKEACFKLIEYCLSDMTKINNETQKLIGYCAERKTVTAKDVEALVVKDSDYQVYEMVQAAAEANYKKAYDSLYDLLSKNNDEQKLFVSLYFYFRRLLFCSVSDKTDSELAAALGVKEYAVKKSREQARAFSQKKLLNTVNYFTRCDADFKSGKISLDNALWNSFFKVLIG